MKSRPPRYGQQGRLVASALCFTILLALLITSCATMSADKAADNPPDDQKGFRFFQRRF
jgi:hypothetical protein